MSSTSSQESSSSSPAPSRPSRPCPNPVRERASRPRSRSSRPAGGRCPRAPCGRRGRGVGTIAGGVARGVTGVDGAFGGASARVAGAAGVGGLRRRRRGLRGCLRRGPAARGCRRACVGLHGLRGRARAGAGAAGAGRRLVACRWGRPGSRRCRWTTWGRARHPRARRGWAGRRGWPRWTGGRARHPRVRRGWARQRGRLLRGRRRERWRVRGRRVPSRVALGGRGRAVGARGRGCAVGRWGCGGWGLRLGRVSGRAEVEPALGLVGAAAAGRELVALLLGLTQADPAAAAQHEPQHHRQDHEHRDDHDDDPQGLRHPPTLSRRATPCAEHPGRGLHAGPAPPRRPLALRRFPGPCGSQSALRGRPQLATGRRRWLITVVMPSPRIDTP